MVLPLFSLLGGFVVGNLTPGALPFVSWFGPVWPGSFIGLVLILFEIFNASYFSTSQSKFWLKVLNFGKIGFLLGLFTDAFKVGS